MFSTHKKKQTNTNKEILPIKKQNPKLSKSLNNKISKLFKKEKLEINFEEFLKLLQKSIEYREYSKFIFSKSINSVFENLIKFTKKLNITKKVKLHLRLALFYRYTPQKYIQNFNLNL